MAKYTVLTMPGDGIGNQVLPESLRVLKAIGFDAEYIRADIGWDCWCAQGNALPDRTIELLNKHKLGLFGAITSKPNKAAQAELKPELQEKGYVYYSPIVTMRQKFNLDICMRPCVGFTGNPLNYIRKKVDGGYDEPQIDTTVFRQGTEGMYAGVEWTNPPEIAVSCRIITRKAAQRIVTAAFEYAKKRGFKGVTICEKPNVVRETSGMMEEVAKEVAKNYPGIALWSTNIDAQLMWLNKNPEEYNVIE